MMSPAPKTIMLNGSDKRFDGRAPVPMKSANAPELINGKTTSTSIRVTSMDVFFTILSPAMISLIGLFFLGVFNFLSV